MKLQIVQDLERRILNPETNPIAKHGRQKLKEKAAPQPAENKKRSIHHAPCGAVGPVPGSPSISTGSILSPCWPHFKPLSTFSIPPSSFLHQATVDFSSPGVSSKKTRETDNHSCEPEHCRWGTLVVLCCKPEVMAPPTGIHVGWCCKPTCADRPVL